MKILSLWPWCLDHKQGDNICYHAKYELIPPKIKSQNF